MRIQIKNSFLKDIQKVSEPQKSKVKFFLEELHSNPTIIEFSYSAKKLKGGKKKGNFFRIRFGDYRLGYKKSEDEITIYRILHRKDMYKFFP